LIAPGKFDEAEPVVSDAMGLRRKHLRNHRSNASRVLPRRQHNKNRPAVSEISAPGKASDLQLAKAPIKTATNGRAAPMSSHFQATPSPASETTIVIRPM
jgi:hypothetical protein